MNDVVRVLIFIVLCCNIVQCGAVYWLIVYITWQYWNKFKCFSAAVYSKEWRDNKYFMFKASDYVEQVRSFYVCGIC